MAIADRAFREASYENLGAMMLAGPMQEEVESRLSRFQYYHHYFHELGRISGGTEPVIAKIEQEIIPRLERHKLDNNESPIQTIRRKLEGWEGPYGSASYKFKNDYLPPLATSLENQYSTMEAMAGVMKTHEAVIDQARQKYLDLIDSTTTAIDENTELQRESSNALSVTEVVAGITAGMGVGASGGPWGAVAGVAFGVLQVVGPRIDEALNPPGGDSWFSITDDALGQFEDLVTAVNEETHGVESALDQVLVYVEGESRDEYLAPEVNPGGPAPDEGYVPPTS